MTLAQEVSDRAPGSPPPSSSSVRRRTLAIGLRTAIGVVVVAVLLARAHVHALAESLAHANGALVAAGFLVLLAGLVVNAFRWQVFLRPLGLSLPGRTLVRLTFVGTFFNAFLPTGVGGDAYKSFRLRGRAAGMALPMATVILDRLAGLAGLAVLAVAGAAIRVALGHRDAVTVVGSVLGLGVLLACVAALRLAPRWAKWDHGAESPAGRSRLRLFAAAFVTAGRDRGAVRGGALVGVVSGLLLVAVNWLLAASLHLGVPPLALPGIVLIATLTAALPFTINGLGFREAAYVWSLSSLGFGHDAGLAFALLVLAVTLGSSAAGGVVYAVSGGDVPSPVTG